MSEPEAVATVATALAETVEFTQKNEVPIRTLREGDGFGLLLETTGRVRKGYVISIGSCSATIMLLDRVERTIRTGDGREIPISSPTGVQHWSIETMVVPDGTRHDVARHSYQNQKEENDMSNSSKKTKAQPKVRVRAILADKLYEVATANVSEKFSEQVADKEVKSHTVLVFRALKKLAKPSTVEQVAAAVKADGQLKTDKKDFPRLMRDHLSLLAKKRFVKVSDAPEKKA